MILLLMQHGWSWVNAEKEKHYKFFSMSFRVVGSLILDSFLKTVTDVAFGLVLDWKLIY